MLPVVALVGRPNVGKSTLFNRIIGFKKAVVHDRPGVTRDRLYEEAEALERRFMVVDTGGIEPDQDDELFRQMRKQVMVALDEADVVVFVVDGRVGITAADHQVAELLRKQNKPVVLAVNKIDGERHDELVAEFWSLGLDALVPVSAAHGRGMYELMEAVVAGLPPAQPGERDEPTDEDQDASDIDLEDAAEGNVDLVDPKERPSVVRIAVIGRPNIGKSTLVNHLLGEERHVVHDMPGTTMDPVDSTLVVDGRPYVLVDTAGVRRKSRIEDQLERFVSLRSIQAIERAHVCLLMVDATEGITDQDARLVELVVDRGRALIVLFNKWDLVKQRDDVDAKSIEAQKERDLPHATWAPHLFVSAKTGKGLHRVLPTVDQVFEEFNRHLSTSEVNRFLERVLSTHTPPQRYHRPVRLYYGTQSRIRPPTFVFFSNTPEGVVPAYKQFLANRLRQEYGFTGTPVKLHFRKRRKPGEPKNTFRP